MDKKARMRRMFDDGPVGMWVKMGAKKAIVGLVGLTALLVCVGILIGH